MAIIYRLAFIAFAMLSVSCLEAQNTLVLPIKVVFYDDQDRSNKKAKSLGGMLESMQNRVVDSTQTKALQKALQQKVVTATRTYGAKTKVLIPGDLNEELQAELAKVRFTMSTAVKSKAMLIGRKKYEDQLSSQLAPILNRLCDEYNVDQILLLSVVAANDKKKYKKKKKDPSGSLGVSYTLFDGNSGLVLKKQGKSKGASENVPTSYKLTAESIGKVLEEVIKSAL